jgi:predicted transcriptional regulator
MQMYGVNSVSDMQIILTRHGVRILQLGLVMGLMILTVPMFLLRQKMTPSDLKQARMLAQLTQQALANLLGVNIRTVRRWEAGECRIPGSARMVLENYIRENFLVDKSIPALLRRQAC